MINVTKPFLPPIEEYHNYLKGIWERNWLTNNGPLVNELELKLKEYLQLSHLLFLTNGTVALQVAIKALELKGEIITTPFSYVATTSSIVWEGCEPVFVDISPATLNIDATKIEAAITPQTVAILATHVFGNPCDIVTIQNVADKHNLRVIYDAAHSFGTLYNGKSVFAFGDISTTSFHATKLYHSIEGGAVFTLSPVLLKKMSFMRNFGHNGPDEFAELGINGKNSEFHAAMGLLNLRYVDAILADRINITDRYNRWLLQLGLQQIEIASNVKHNYAYYPIIFESESDLLEVMNELYGQKIFPRRYFYPSLSSLKYVKTYSVPNAEDISRRILCLPVYYQMPIELIDMICRIINRVIKY